MAYSICDLLYFILLSPLLIISAGGLVYYLLAIVAARKLYDAREDAEFEGAVLPAISLLKPLCGADPDLARHLESFFLQGYPSFEILFAVRQADDPAVAIAERLMERYPHIPARMILTGEPPYANAKVYSMKKMADAASADILVITDSDTSVSKDYLQNVAAAFAPERVGAATSLYRGGACADLWSKLEALGMSTEFMAGVVVANYLEGMKFTLGPSMAVRRDCLRAIGGFEAMADYLADDFVLGEWASRAGYQVALMRRPVTHHATALGFTTSFKHLLRWNRSSRFSRPNGYIGQGFTYGLPWALLLFLFAPFWWSGCLLLAVAAARFWMAYEMAARLLDDGEAINRFWLIPLHDILSCATWIGAFMGREIVWRNERYRLLQGGKFEPVIPRSANR
jgi:ceramide glucosyltransferase